MSTPQDLYDALVTMSTTLDAIAGDALADLRHRDPLRAETLMASYHQANTALRHMRRTITRGHRRT